MHLAASSPGHYSSTDKTRFTKHAPRKDPISIVGAGRLYHIHSLTGISYEENQGGTTLKDETSTYGSR